jgi:hypothetical protein
MIESRINDVFITARRQAKRRPKQAKTILNFVIFVVRKWHQEVIIPTAVVITIVKSPGRRTPPPLSTSPGS